MVKIKFKYFFCLSFFCWLFTSLVEAQCPVPTLTPVSWGSSSGNFNSGAGALTLSSAGPYASGQASENAEAAYVTMAGDGQIQAQLETVTGFLGANTVAGIFIRGGTQASGNGGILVSWGPSLATIKFADRTGSGPLTQLDSFSFSVPCWLRIQNSSNVLYPSVSTDGASWTPMPTPYYDLSHDSPAFAGNTLIYGLVVFNETTSSPSTAVFANVCTGALTGFTPIITSAPTSTHTPAPPLTPTYTATVTPTATPSPLVTYSPTPNFSATPTPPPGFRVWPNPFTPQVSPNDRAHFLLSPGHGAGQLMIVDLRRRKIRSFPFPPGEDVQWDGLDDGGNVVSSGVYLYLLESDGTVWRGTVTVMR